MKTDQKSIKFAGCHCLEIYVKIILIKSNFEDFHILFGRLCSVLLKLSLLKCINSFLCYFNKTFMYIRFSSSSSNVGGTQVSWCRQQRSPWLLNSKLIIANIYMTKTPSGEIHKCKPIIRTLVNFTTYYILRFLSHSRQPVFTLLASNIWHYYAMQIAELFSANDVRR